MLEKILKQPLRIRPGQRMLAAGSILALGLYGGLPLGASADILNSAEQVEQKAERPQKIDPSWAAHPLVLADPPWQAAYESYAATIFPQKCLSIKYLKHLGEYLTQQGVRFATLLPSHKFKLFELRILPEGDAPLNLLAQRLAQDKFPLVLNAHYNLKFNDVWHKFWGIDLAKTKVVIGTWFLALAEQQAPLNLMPFPAVLSLYQQHTPDFLRDAELNVEALESLPTEINPHLPIFARQMIHLDPPVFLPREIKRQHRFWHDWGRLFSLYVLARQMEQAKQLGQTPTASLLAEIQNLYYQLLTSIGYRLADLNVVIYTLVANPQRVQLQQTSQTLQLKAYAALDNDEFAYVLQLPLRPTEKITQKLDVLQVASLNHLYHYLNLAHRQLWLLAKQIDALNTSAFAALDLADQIKDLTKIVPLAQKAMREEPLLAYWQKNLATDQRLVAHTLRTGVYFFRERNNLKRQKSCLAFLTSPIATNYPAAIKSPAQLWQDGVAIPWISELQDWIKAPPKVVRPE